AGGDTTTLTIGGHDLESPNIMMERALSLEVELANSDDPEAMLGKELPVEVMYVEEAAGFMPKVTYNSGEDDKPAHVVFEKLELGEDSGHASGSFRASLCRIDMSKLGTDDAVDLSDCIPVEAEFDTELLPD